MKGNNLDCILWLCSQYAKPDSFCAGKIPYWIELLHIIKNAGLISGHEFCGNGTMRRARSPKWRVTHQVSVLRLEVRFKSDPAALTIYFVQLETHYPVHLMLTALL